MTHHTGTDLDQLELQTGQRPVGHRLGQVNAAQEGCEIVGQCVQLQPDLVVAEPLARQPGLAEGILSFLDVLLGGAALVVDAVLVDMTRQLPNPPGIFVLDDGMGLVAKRLEHIPNSDPPAVRVISDNKRYLEYERTAEEIRIIGRIRWFAREI